LTQANVRPCGNLDSFLVSFSAQTCPEFDDRRNVQQMLRSVVTTLRLAQLDKIYADALILALTFWDDGWRDRRIVFYEVLRSV
jgi:hypothetical protein